MELSLFAASFPDKQSAARGAAFIKQLDEEGIVKLAAYAIASKDDRGGLAVEESDTPGAKGALLAGIIGGLAGLLGGPAVAAFGVAAGALSGGWFDVNRAGERSNFGERVAAQISRNRWALLAQAAEPEAAVKERIEQQIAALGGSILQ